MGNLTGQAICTSGSAIYANNVACAVDEYIGDFVDNAIAAEALLDQALADLQAAYENNITPVDYSPDFTAATAVGTYVEPTADPQRGDYEGPEEVELPDREALLGFRDWTNHFNDAKSKIEAALTLSRDPIVNSSEWTSFFNNVKNRIATLFESPDRAGLLSEAQWDAIYARARARVLRGSALAERNALEQTGSLGLGLPEPAITARVTAAAQERKEEISKTALNQAAEEALAIRDDIKFAVQVEFDNLKAVLEQALQEATAKRQDEQFIISTELDRLKSILQRALATGEAERNDIQFIISKEIENFQAKWEVTAGVLKAEEDTLRSELQLYEIELRKEAEKRGWKQMEYDKALTQARDDVQSRIEWARLTLEKLTRAEEIIVQMKAAVFSGWLDSAQLQLSFQGSQAITG